MKRLKQEILVNGLHFYTLPILFSSLHVAEAPFRKSATHKQNHVQKNSSKSLKS